MRTIRPHRRRSRRACARADAVLFVTPEYNRSCPACSERARRRVAAQWTECVDGKPCAISSVSPGAAGAFGATHHLRQTLVD